MACSIAVYGITRAVLHRKEGSLIALTGFIIVFLTIINDMLHSQSIIHTAYITQFGLVAFIFAQSYMLSKLFANTFRRAERLNLELGVAYNEIVEKERARTLFFHNTSHELRTPLNGIIGFAELVYAGHFGALAKPAGEQIGKIKNLAESLKLQVNAILDLAKAKKGEMSLEIRQINLNQMAQESSILAQGLMMQKENASFDIETSWPQEQEMFFFNDQEKLLTLLRNLLGNAVKFARPDQPNQVKLKLQITAHQGLVITVSDTGIGIPKSQLESIFEEFKQVEGQASRSFEGTGLGLAMVKNIVDLMEGNIQISSEVDQGSVFTVTLPSQDHGNIVVKEEMDEKESDYVVATPTGQKIETDGKTAAESVGLPQLESDSPAAAESHLMPDPDNAAYTVLVVDDIQINVEVLSEHLRAQGYKVQEAYGGREALQKMRIKKPDLMLLDLMMPEVSGEDVLKQVRADESLHDLPVIIVTARASQDDRLLGLGMGADDYLAKPIISQEMLLRVKSILTRQQLSQAIGALVSQERFAQLGLVMADLATEIKKLQKTALSGLSSAREPFENRLKSFSELKPFWNSLIPALFNPITRPAKDKQNRLRQLSSPLNIAVEDQGRLKLLASILSSIKTSDDFLMQIWADLKQLKGTQLFTIVETFKAIRSFATIQENTLIAQNILESITAHQNFSQEESYKLSEVINLGLGLLFQRFLNERIRVILPEENQLEVEIICPNLEQVFVNILLASRYILLFKNSNQPEDHLAAKQIEISAGSSNGKEKDIFALQVRLLVNNIADLEKDIFSHTLIDPDGQVQGPGLKSSRRLMEKSRGYLNLIQKDGAVFELGMVKEKE